jgi:hypothetical protein
MKWVKNAARIAETTNAPKIMIVKPEMKRLPERSRHRWYEHIKIYLKNRLKGWRLIHLDHNIKIWKAVACTVTKFSDFKRTGILPLAE